jgi:putative serine protease PepD
MFAAASHAMSRGRLYAACLTVVALLVTVVAAGCGQSADQGVKAPTVATASPGTPGPFALEQQFKDVIRTVSPSVVQVQTTKGLGSGVVFDDQGDIVTNAHVVGTAKTFNVTLANGDRHGASLIGADVTHDIAVIRLSGAKPPPAEFADSAAVEAGDIALAMGNPLGLRSSVTQGIVSGERRDVTEQSGVTLPSAIQTSAAINPGNSGGALVDLRGRVIGTPTLAALDPQLGNSQAPGIGFAIPSNTVKSIATLLLTRGAPVTAR